MDFKKFLEFAWADEIGKMVPKMGLELPLVHKSGTIETVEDKKNPIYVQLSDGTKLYFTSAEFRRIKGIPEKGRTMTVTMQRHPADASGIPSQIVSAQVT